MLHIDGINTQLGGLAKLETPVATLRDLEQLIEHGIPKNAVLAFANHLASGPAAPSASAILQRLVSRSSFRRHSRFKGALAERIIRVANVRAMAEFIIGNPRGANDFFFRRHPELEWTSPFEASKHETGARMAEDILERAALGLSI